MTIDPTAPSAEAISAGVLALAPYFPPDTVIAPDAAEEGEYVLAPLEQIVAAIISAALPLLSVPDAGEVERLRKVVAQLEATNMRDRERLALRAKESTKARNERDEAVARVERVREVAQKWGGYVETEITTALAARTPDDDAETVLVDAGPCDEELHSWSYFRPEQVDSYWMTCSLTKGHDGDHENSDTGATWAPDDDAEGKR